MTRTAIAGQLRECLEASVDSLDLARIEAVHAIIAHEHARGLDGLLREIEHDPVAFILEAAPGFSGALKLATGHSRDAWADLCGRPKGTES